MTEPAHAPDFPHHFYWINSQQPLSLIDDLQGYVVLAWFFRTSSVNCHHVVPTLHYLEQRFAARAFKVIGVHSGAFDAEQDPDHVADAVRLWGLRHPVVVDSDQEMWRDYGCKAWPTIALIDAVGNLRFAGAGEPDRDRMAAAIEFLLDDAAAAGDEPYMQLERCDSETPASLDGLWFPAGVAVDEVRQLLWIADTARHRVLGARLADGAVVHTVGRGEPGAADGDFATACLSGPTGLCCQDGMIYVTEPANHLVRRIDPDAGRVDTVLGTGRAVVDHLGGGVGRQQPINSPWGITAHGDELLVAMAGLHQLWRVETTRRALPCTGSGAVGRADGTAAHASLSQPLGLAVRGDRLAFVDSESGAVRVCDLGTAMVRTVAVGAGPGAGAGAGAGALQCPTAVVWHGDDHLVVADTLNDRLVRIRIDDGSLEVLDIDVHRPFGLAMAGDGEVLFVADTGNHRIVRADLGTATSSTFALASIPRAATAFGTDYQRAAAITLAPMAEISLRLPMDLPAGATLQPDTVAELTAENVEGYPLLVDVTIVPDVEAGWFVARGIATGDLGKGVIRLRLGFVTCPEPGQVCHLHERRIELPLRLVAGAPDRADVVVGVAPESP